MAVILWVMGLSLLLQGCLCSVGETNRGCKSWRLKGDNVCCDACHPGNRLVKQCGPSSKDLCTPCEPGTFTVNPKNYRCTRCTQCVGAQVFLKACTATSDTKCGCKDGLTCGDGSCSFCVKKCDKGHEPTEDGSCRPCSEGTFNDQSHQTCRPWSTKCPNPDEQIVAKGDAFTDIRCNASVISSIIGPTEEEWPWVSVFIIVGLITFFITITITVIVGKKIKKTKPNGETPVTKTPIIRTPTDDPRTLIAIECSFHEAQQEQGSSSESLDSKDSSDQLIA